MKITINGSTKDILALIGNGNQSADGNQNADAIADAVMKKLDERIIDNLPEGSDDNPLKVIVPNAITTSWALIKNAIDRNMVDWIPSGSKIPVTLKNGEILNLVVARDENGKRYFIFDNCWPERHCMSEKPCKEGWKDSDLRAFANDEEEGIFSILPDDLQAVIVPTLIQYKYNNKRIECHDKLFCLSMTEVFGNGPWHENEPEDTWLDIFQDGDRSRVKNLSGSAVWWWLRSAANYDYFDYVTTSGGVNYASATNSGGVALGFCLES